MYYPTESNIEEVCYNPEHIENVLSEIKLSFHDYFDKFLETQAGTVVASEEFSRLVEHFNGNGISTRTSNSNLAKHFKSILTDCIASYERDREHYLKILDQDAFEEYREDPSFFKNTVLKNECPIIRTTLQNRRARELDKFRRAFNLASAGNLLEVVYNIMTFAHAYMDETYDAATYDNMLWLEDLGLEELNQDEYFAFGVIGGGIRSQFMYKMYPCVFPYRSREAVWSLWYLTKKKSFDCQQDSEFLMINTRESTTQQNYFYPYDLFSYYAFQIYLMIKNEAKMLGVHINDEYRYVIVDSFLSYVAQCHEEEINFLRMQLKEESYD